MASAQVLSNSLRKQELLEAGKRRLEEFRKKKAEAKKAVSTTSQPPAVETLSNEKQVSDNGEAPSGRSASSAYVTTDTMTRTSGILNRVDTTHGFANDSGSGSVTQVKNDSQNNNFRSPDLLQALPKQVGNGNGASEILNQSGSIYTESRDHKVGTFETDIGEIRTAVAVSQERSVTMPYGSNSNFRSSISGGDEDFGFSVNLPNSGVSANDYAAKMHSDRQANNLLHPDPVSINSRTDSQPSASEYAHDQHGALEFKNYVTSVLEERQPNFAVGNLRAFGNQLTSDPLSGGFRSSSSGSSASPLSSAGAETYPRRSRPSFLETLNIGRNSPTSGRSFPVKEDLTAPELPNNEFAVPSVIADTSLPSAPVEPLPTPASSSTNSDIFGSSQSRQNLFAVPSVIADTSLSSAPVEPLPTPASLSTNSDIFGSSQSGQNLFENSLRDFKSQRHNEDFAALEQHIEDLTQEKFSLQRALEASKTLAESLAAENSSLTESYNQQTSNVGQIKVEMERLQEEIKARMVELEAIKAEYTNAQLECNAADERAKILASEVISLEEKALRLRSNELKLERELEKSGVEIASYKKKSSSLERERCDLQQTIEALQEEKKLLQSKLRRASTSASQADLYNGHPKKDASTSTKDLGSEALGGSSEEVSSNTEFGDDTSGVMLLLHNSSTDGFAMSIPPDQMQMIQNINSLISEIMSEKEELMQALVNEVSTSTKLKDLNKELSHKLEIQTQRLELLTAQSMASENIQARQPSESRIVRDSVAYADEGDEVVERVLGWIMKLFPGGPSKRRTSRL